MKNLKQITPSVFFFLSVFFAAFTSKAQVIDFQDANFKARLVLNHQINLNGDNEIQITEAAAFSGTLNVSNASIQNMNGIQFFSRISSLNCSNNDMTLLDISNNLSLNRLDCSNNQLLELNLSNLYNITFIDVHNNLLPSLNVLSCIDLATLVCHHNKIERLDLSTTTELVKLDCSFNNLSVLELTKTRILQKIDCSNNQLVVLNIANGNNQALVSADFDAKNNLLNCVGVDDANFASFNWTGSVDTEAYFSNNCIALPIKDISVGDFTLYPNPTSGTVSIFLGGIFEKISVEVFNTSGSIILKNSYDNKDAINIDLDVIPGIYMIAVNTTKGTSITKKLFVR